MICIQIINSGALIDALQNVPRDLPVVIIGEEVQGPYLIRNVEIRDYYQPREGIKLCSSIRKLRLVTAARSSKC